MIVIIITISLMIFCRISVLLVTLCWQAYSMVSITTFSTLLYIPGTYFSLTNLTYDVTNIEKYYDVDINYQLTQAAAEDQGNSVYDFFIFEGSQYVNYESCYVSAIAYLNTLYNQFEPCQGGCNFQAYPFLNQNSTQFKLINQSSNSITMIVDNTFYPCTGGAYQSEVIGLKYRQKSFKVGLSLPNCDFNDPIQPGFHPHNKNWQVFVVLLQILIFLFAYIMIMINKLQDKKKRLKKVREEKEDLDVLNIDRLSETQT